MFDFIRRVVDEIFTIQIKYLQFLCYKINL